MTELAIVLAEVRQEITRINTTAGFTVFNPAVTQLLEEAHEDAKVVLVKPAHLKNLAVKAAKASELTVAEMIDLAAWCEGQSSDLWDGLSLQEVLNVYRASAEWINFELWAEDEGDKARKAWNRVVRPANHLETAGR